MEKLSKISDKRLAAEAYVRAGIPMSEWHAHWKLDTRPTHGDLTSDARAAYKAIRASYRGE